MPDMPLVSAVIPTYNSAHLAPEAVQSVLDQTYANVDIVVVDDGSSDNTVDCLKAFGSAITLIRQDHQGPAVARNRGIRESTGEMVAFLDSDDVWLPEKLDRCVEALRARPQAGVVYTALRMRELDTGRRYKLSQYTHEGWMARDLFLECKGVNTSTLVVRRSCLDAVNGFDEDFFRAQDWDLMLRLAEQFQYAHVPEVLTERRLHAGALSVRHRDLYAKYNLMVTQKAVARKPGLYAGLENDALARAHVRFGLDHYRDFNMAEARVEFQRSLSYRWNGTAFNYLLRTYLPAGLVRALRRVRQGRRPSVAPVSYEGDPPNA